MMRLLLVRHGESNHNVEHFIAQAACTGLTERGRQQAEQVAQRLKAEHGDGEVLLSTSVQRAQETAAIIGRYLDQPVQVNDGMSEVMPGDADGMTQAQYEQRFGAFQFAAQPDRPFAPNGESWNQFVDRVQTTLDTFQQTYDGQHVIAVTHGGFIVVSFLLLFQSPFFSERAFLNPANTSITEWQVVDGRWQLERYNDTSHLSG